MRQFRQLSNVVVMLAGAAACTSPTAPLDSSALRLEQPLPVPGTSALRAGVVRLGSDAFLVEAPSTATAGQPFTVAVTTYGGGCIREDTTLVDVSDHRADVVPYQRVYRGLANSVCTLELRVTRRQVQVVISQTGQATVRFIGRSSPGDSLVLAERSVSIR